MTSANDKIDIKELMETYPYIPQKKQQLHKLLRYYNDLLSYLGQDALQAQKLSDMPRETGTSDPTSKYALRYQEAIDEYEEELEILDRKRKWCDKLRRELFGKDWELLELAYSKRRTTYTISRKLNINKHNVDAVILAAEERARKLIN